jgi:predicted ATPase/class 3 adenylate cyclase
MGNLPTGTVTFLFTDIEGSTKLAQEHPDTWESLRERHHAILKSAIESHNGYVFQIIGDAYCAAFHIAGDALRAAIKSQLNLHNGNWGDGPIKVRMGIHTGKAEVQENGEYHGYLAMSRVQRLMSAGHGEQTLISQATQELIRDELPQGITLRDMGERRLKDLIHPEHIYQVDIPNLPSEFPALKTLDVQLNNLPAQMTPFVGREREITAVLGLMRNSDVRLVTLTGAGGTGKTRLSLQVAADILDEYEHGVWFVELASISNPDLVLPTIASTLKVKESARTPIEQTLHEYLSKRQLLLVIDNFEQVVSAAPVIGKLLSAAPKVKIVVSSREVLHLRGEHDYPVPPLGLPESKRKQTAAVLAQYEAIALFIQHAQAANPSFELDEENASIVAEICMKLDGLPLAIELAAARSRLLKPAVMLEKLKSRLNVLTGGARDLPQRQQTIRGAIDWSYELLDESEKVLFARLGVFIGGWTVESAEVVCSAGLSIDVLSGIESLLDKSLLRQYEGKSGESRFTMLETIREYAFEKLSQSSELSAIQQAHANYMEHFLQSVLDARNSPEQDAWFIKLDDQMDNLRSAVEWTLARQQPSLAFKAGTPFHYWDQRWNYRDPIAWLERGLAIEYHGEPREHAQALNSLGGLLTDAGYHQEGNLQRARGYFESALALYREIGDNDGVAQCLSSLGNNVWKEKEIEKARQFFEEALEVYPDANSWGYAVTLMNLGSLAVIRGDYQEALDDYVRGQEICVRIGAETGASFFDWMLCKLALAQRKLDEALAHIQNLLKAGWMNTNPLVKRLFCSYAGYIQLLLGNKPEAQKILNDALEGTLEYFEISSILPGEKGDFWFIFDGKARLELMDGNFERAAVLFGVAWTQRAEAILPPTAAERPDYEARIAEARSAIRDAAFDTAFKKGQAMKIKDALIFALDESNE